MDKKILAKDTYENIKKMFESSDLENATVAVECIKNTDLKGNLTYLLLLLKETNITKQKWQEYIPDIFTTLDEITESKNFFISYKEILNVLSKYKVSSDDYQFFMDRYALYLKEMCGEDIEFVSIKIKLKT